MMVSSTTEICRSLAACNKIHFTKVNSLAIYTLHEIQGRIFTYYDGKILKMANFGRNLLPESYNLLKI